jgi:ParB/RepB/Spo0J family partition protein
MTTTDPITGAQADTIEPELCWLNLADLAPHPDNPRSGSLGDLTELVRSISAHGILEPLVVLPADDSGAYLIVAGHRRHAAGQKAGITEVPAVVRAMNPVEVIEAMLSENVNRSDLTVAEEVRAIERLMSLDAGLSPAKLCRRIGKSQAWVRARMAVTVLPERWRTALDHGDLSLAAAEAAASLADLGPEYLDSACAQLAGRNWVDPTRAVANYRDDVRRAERYELAVERARGKHPAVFTSDDPPPDKAKRLGELFDSDNAHAHRDEPCHAVVVRRVGWGDGADTFEVCTDPRRHRPARGDTGSDLTADNTRPAATVGDSSHAKRKGRLARLAHATEVWAKTRGGISQTDLTRLALRGLICEAGREAIGYAATILGYEQPREITHRDLLDAAGTPAQLARVAGAVACGVAETAMYWSPSSSPCRDYLDTLTGSGWTPDPWTADAIEHTTDPGDEPAEDDADDTDDDAGDEDEDDPDLD